MRPPSAPQEAFKKLPGGPKKAPRSLLLLIIFPLPSSRSPLPRGRRRDRDHDLSELRLLVGIALSLDSASFLLLRCTGTVAGLAAGIWIIIMKAVIKVSRRPGSAQSRGPSRRRRALARSRGSRGTSRRGCPDSSKVTTGWLRAGVVTARRASPHKTSWEDFWDAIDYIDEPTLG